MTTATMELPTTVRELEQEQYPLLEKLVQQAVEAPIVELGASVLGELKEGLILTELPAGERRLVHINPKHLDHNRHYEDAKLPLVVVVNSDGIATHYHSAVLAGPVALVPFEEADGDHASIGLITTGAIKVYTDPEGHTRIIPHACGYLYK